MPLPNIQEGFFVFNTTPMIFIFYTRNCTKFLYTTFIKNLGGYV